MCSQINLWGSPSSAFPDISLGFTFCVTRYISGVHLCSQIYLWGSPSSAFLDISLGFTFFCIPRYISGVHLLLHSQLYLWGSPSSAFLDISLGFTFFCIPSYISGVHVSSSPAGFPARSLWSTFFFFFCVPSYTTIFGEIFVYVAVFFLFLFLKSNHSGRYIPFWWMVHAGYVFVAGIHPSRTNFRIF